MNNVKKKLQNLGILTCVRGRRRGTRYGKNCETEKSGSECLLSQIEIDFITLLFPVFCFIKENMQILDYLLSIVWRCHVLLPSMWFIMLATNHFTSNHPTSATSRTTFELVLLSARLTSIESQPYQIVSQ